MLKQHKIIVIAGLSGVGKSFLIEKAKRDITSIVHFSAGALIKKYFAEMDRDQLRLLNPNAVLQNQYVLIEQFNQELGYLSGPSLILFDAHMIIDSDDRITEIPFDIFFKLTPSQIIFLYEEPNIIIERRKKDALRIRPTRSIDQIEKQQDLSLAMAEDYACRLSIPFTSLKSSDKNSLSKIIAQVD